MTVWSKTDKNLTQKAQISRYVIAYNIYLSKSRQTIKIIDLEGHLLGIAICDEILDLLAGKISHVNVVRYRSNPPLNAFEGN